VLQLAQVKPELLAPLSDSRDTIGAEIVFILRHEMAQNLGDVVFRRTGLGTIGHPGAESLAALSDLVRSEWGWDEERVVREIEQVNDHYVCH
jgi:glycerol-3-phosphate dehydrogenase